MNTHEIAIHIQTHKTPAVLATLIEVEGHSYRKPGAVMLFLKGHDWESESRLFGKRSGVTYL